MSRRDRRREGREYTPERSYRRRRDGGRDHSSSRRRDDYSRRSKSPRRSPRGDYSRRGERDGTRRRSSPRRGRRSPRRSSPRNNRRSRRRDSLSSSDGIYSSDGLRSRSRRGGRDRRRGADRHDDDIKDYIANIYKEFSYMYSMIKKETQRIRDSGDVMFSRSHRTLDLKDHDLPKELSDNDSLEMLKSLCKEAEKVKEKLNKNYRTKFFHKVKRRMERSRKERDIEPRSDEERYRDRADRDSRRYDREYRSSGSRAGDRYDRDRSRRDDYSPRDRRERRRRY